MELTPQHRSPLRQILRGGQTVETPHQRRRGVVGIGCPRRAAPQARLEHRPRRNPRRRAGTPSERDERVHDASGSAFGRESPPRHASPPRSVVTTRASSRCSLAAHGGENSGRAVRTTRSSAAASVRSALRSAERRRSHPVEILEQHHHRLDRADRESVHCTSSRSSCDAAARGSSSSRVTRRHAEEVGDPGPPLPVTTARRDRWRREFRPASRRA